MIMFKPEGKKKGQTHVWKKWGVIRREGVRASVGLERKTQTQKTSFGELGPR